MSVTIGAINRLFVKLQARYGNQWASQWANQDLYKIATKEWFDGLQYLDLMDIKNGLDNYDGDFPPNLSQFKHACTTTPNGHPAPCYNEYKQLPVKKSTTEHGNNQIDKIRGYLK